MMDGLQTMKSTIEDERFVLVKLKLSTRRTLYEAICDCMSKFFNKFSLEQSILKLLYVHVVVKQLLRLFQQAPAIVNQHPPAQHEGWMISDQETVFC